MITGKILKLAGWPEGRLIGLAKAAAEALDPQDEAREATLARLAAVRANPGAFFANPLLSDLARACLRQTAEAAAPAADELRDEPLPYPTWGAEHIEPSARAQMDNALRLPVAVAGALMPDAHLGYGVPIGAVLATEGAAVPYAVGVDIACRMRLSIYPISPIALEQQRGRFERALLDQTRFGVGGEWKRGERPEHPVLDDEAWRATRLLSSLRDTAVKQLGTSGSGNHFVEFGAFRLAAADSQLGLEAGEYLALLSHSGSRGVGYKICETYTRIAREQHPRLDKRARDLAWLDLSGETGQEYWLSMELAGRFASANHAVIHRRVAEAAGLKEAAAVENHHNFCIAGDQKIPTPNGYKLMKDVIPGDLVYSFDPVRGFTERPVLDRWNSGRKRIHTIRTSNREIRVSEDHPVLAIRVLSETYPSSSWHKKASGSLAWVPAGKLMLGDIIVCADGYYAEDRPIGLGLARLVGAFLGDGWIRHSGASVSGYSTGLAIGRQDEKHTARYLELCETYLPQANWHNSAAGAFGITCSSKAVHSALIELGLGDRSDKKHVPAYAFRLPRPEKLALLSGYFDADGSVANSNNSNHGRGTIANVSQELVDGLRELAIGCGLRVTPVIRSDLKINYGVTTVYRCHLDTDSVALLELWHEKKSVNQCSTKYHRKQGLQLSKIGYLILPSGTFGQTVRAIEVSKSEEDVFDLSVEHPEHSFVCEGVAVHNCWKESHFVLENGHLILKEVLVHRKGATPAGPGVLGVIPGTMGDPGYVVRGRGLPGSLHSASHGAGRAMSSRRAKETITKTERDRYLAARGVRLLGDVGLDEAPQAYKRVEAIIAAQSELVDIIGTFAPRVVRMTDEKGEI